MLNRSFTVNPIGHILTSTGFLKAMLMLTTTLVKNELSKFAFVTD